MWNVNVSDHQEQELLHELSLVEMACRGDADAFAVLIGGYESSLDRFCWKLMPGATAQDLAQETRLRAFQSIRRLQDPHRFGAWLFGIAANLAKWWWRRQSRYPISLEGLRFIYPDVTWEEMLPATSTTDRVVEEAEQTARLVQAIRSLPAEMGHVVVLHYLEGLSYAEVAVALDVPISTVKGRLYKSRLRLRQDLEAAMSEGGGASGTRSNASAGERGQERVRRRQRKGQNDMDEHRHDGVGLVTVTVESVKVIYQEPDAAHVRQALEQGLGASWLTPASLIVQADGMPRQPDFGAVAEQLAAALAGTDIKIADSARSVVLREVGGGRQLTFCLGSPEAFTIALRLHGHTTPRPLTADTTQQLLEASGAEIERVAVTRLVGDTFYASIWLRRADGETVEIDARPSDAIGLALRARVPILVAEGLLKPADELTIGMSRDVVLPTA